MSRKHTTNLTKTRVGRGILGAAIAASGALGALAATSLAATSPTKPIPTAIGIGDPHPSSAIYAPASYRSHQPTTHTPVKRQGSGPSHPTTSPVTSPATGGSGQEASVNPAIAKTILPVTKTVLSRGLAMASQDAAVFGTGAGTGSGAGDTISLQDILSAADSQLAADGISQAQISGFNSWAATYQNLPANPADLSQAQITQIADAPNAFLAATGASPSQIATVDQVTADSLNYMAQVTPVYQESWANGLSMTQGQTDQVDASWSSFAGELGVDPNTAASTPLGDMSIPTMTAAVNFTLASGQYTYNSYGGQLYGVGMFQNDINTADWEYVMQGPLGGYGAFGGYGIFWDGAGNTSPSSGGGLGCSVMTIVHHNPLDPIGLAGTESPSSSRAPAGTASEGRLHGHQVYAGGCTTATA